MLLLQRFRENESGASSIEYGLIAALMAVVIISGLMVFAPKMKRGLLNIGDEMAQPKNLTAG